MTPIQLACWQGSLEVIPILLAHGASAGLASYCGRWLDSTLDADSLAFLLCGKCSRDAAGLLPAVKVLLAHGANPLALRPFDLTIRMKVLERVLITDAALPVEVRRCLVNAILARRRWVQLLQREKSLFHTIMCAAAMCGKGNALLKYFHQVSQHNPSLFTELGPHFAGECDGLGTVSGSLCSWHWRGFHERCMP